MAAPELRTSLLSCFELAGPELFVAHADQVGDELENVPPDAAFAAFCTYQEVSGHFAMSFSVGIEGRLAARVAREEFAQRFAAHFNTYVLYGDTEPPGLWSVIRPDGTRLLAELDESDDDYHLDSATAPIPGHPEIPTNPALWNARR